MSGGAGLDGDSLISPGERLRDPDWPAFARNVSKVIFEAREQGETRVDLASDTLCDSNISEKFP